MSIASKQIFIRVIVGCVAVMLMPTTGPVYGGDYHMGDNLQCADCHLQHSSEGGQPIAGGPFSTLLIKNTVNELCLSCHDGSDPAAPDVQAPVTMYNGAVSDESAAGHFAQFNLVNAHGHDLGVSAAIPLSLSGESLELNCAHCHASHGNRNYRNLVYDPGGHGDSLSVEDGVDLFTEFHPDIPPTVSGSVSAYNAANVGYRRNMTEWCAGCHDMLAANSTASTPAHFMAHPSGVGIDEYGLDAHTDPSHWLAGTGEGFAVAAGAAEGIVRVPFEAPGAVDFQSTQTPSTTDRVFCLSCHKSHGNDNGSGLLWPYLEGGTNYIAGCQQCHNK